MCSAHELITTGNPITNDDSTDKNNFSRLHFLYWNAAPAFLRQLFRDVWKLHAESLWEDNKSSGKKLMQSLRSSEITQNCRRFQTDLIKNGNSNQWDLPLLVDIIKNLYLLLQPANNLEFSNTILEDVEVLKHTRNKLAHAGQTTIDGKIFKILWTNSVRILTSMGMKLELMQSPVNSDCDPNDSSCLKEAELKANRFRLVGDEFMDKCLFTEAAAEYSKGINCENVPPQLLGLLFSNRCLAYLEMENWQRAKDDAKSCITLQPQSVLGYARLGRAYEGLENFQKACLNFSIAVRLGDKSKLTDESLHWCKMMMAKRSCKMHLDSDYIKHDCIADIQDLNKKFPHGTKEDFILQGSRYFWGTKCCPVDYEKAAEYFSLAAEMECAYGLFQLGRMTMEGQGVRKDVKKGFELYLKAASQDPMEDLGNGRKQFNEGVPNACHAVGLAYDAGFAVSRDPRKALEWYQKALLCGHAGAANNIGLLMKNSLLRIEFLKLGAHLGLTNAIENLAINYRDQGCLKEAQQYFHYALQRGSIKFKGREDEFVTDPSLINDFDPMKVADVLKNEVHCSRIVGHYMEKIEKFRKVFESNENEKLPRSRNDKLPESLGRNGAIITHRQTLRANHDQLKQSCGWKLAASDSIPSLFGAEKIKFEGLEDICFKEMQFKNDWTIFPRRFMNVTVIEDAIVGSCSIHLLAEDRHGDMGWLAICNYPQYGQSQKKVHEEIGFGCRLTIFYPVVQKNFSGLMEMRVDDPELIFKRKNLRTPDRCRYCGKNEEKPVLCKSCRRAKYCSIACLRNDSEILQHSLVCLKVLN